MNQDLEKSFLIAYEQHSDAIFRFIFFKLNDRERTLDLVQETFMKTWLHMSKNQAIDNTKAFLYTVAGHLVIDEYRKRGRKDHLTSSLDGLNEEGFEPSLDINELEVLSNHLDGKEIMKVIQELPQIYSTVLLMKYAEELSVTEISEVIGETPNVISVRLNRGIKKLKELLESKNNSK
ncbi:MAG: RNA polymerase sigma factor [Patescibacteria group bacterium]